MSTTLLKLSCPDRVGLLSRIDHEVISVEHSHTPDDLVRLGRDCERMALARSVRWHLADRVLMHGKKTVVFRD